FFQAEDGIRDGHVTGVQTCALPISVQLPAILPGPSSIYCTLFDRLAVLDDIEPSAVPFAWRPIRGRIASAEKFASPLEAWMQLRSEERRVGKECRGGGWLCQ